MAGRVALITGAAGGIGRELVSAMLADGLSVVGVDRPGDPLAELERRSTEDGAGARFRAVGVDLAREDAADAIVAAAADAGPVDILIHNAGVNFTRSANSTDSPPKFWEATAEQWRLSVAIHMNAPMALSRALVPPMIERGWGRVLTVTTSLGSMIRGGSPTYGPSKAALEAFASVMAKDLRGTGVTSNVVIPGGITNTGMIPDDSPYAKEDMLQPDVMVPPVRWLLSAAADAVTDRRFVAASWEFADTPEEAAEHAGAPAAWGGLAVLPIHPDRTRVGRPA